MMEEVLSFATALMDWCEKSGYVEFIFDVSDPKDLYCFPNLSPPVVVLGRGWHEAYKQSKREAFKRITHEMIGHICLGLPDNIPDLSFFSHPWKDLFSASAYELFIKGYPFSMNNILNYLDDQSDYPEWISKWEKTGKIGW